MGGVSQAACELTARCRFLRCIETFVMEEDELLTDTSASRIIHTQSADHQTCQCKGIRVKHLTLLLAC
ncbi:hypothetical protein R3I93_006798 [Phoxinus phoxinus]|uniref:Uncharacterized protein n=1 Tax=Phoxinus phoxinus TaxID=58324 RepID=A0AAN9D4T6_9TELE